MIDWQQYDKQTWGYEWDEIDRLALIKETKKGEFTLIVGTVKDAEYITQCATLSNAMARAMRFMMLVLNEADTERLKWKI